MCLLSTCKYHISMLVVFTCWKQAHDLSVSLLFVQYLYIFQYVTQNSTFTRQNTLSFFSSPEPKARVSYCHSASSVVRPSVVRPFVVRPASGVRKLFAFSTSSSEPLDGFWWNLVGRKSSCSLTSVVFFFGQIRPGADPGRGKNRSRWVPFFKKLLLQIGRLQRQTKCIAMV